MDIERAVDDFVLRGKSLFYHLRSEGESLSDLGLRILRIQLHILHIEVARLKRGKLVGSPTKSLRTEKKSRDKCLHSRLVDDCLNAKRERTGFVYCLECGEIIDDTFPKPE